MRRRRVELGRVGAGEAEHVAGELDGHDLHAEAQAEARDAVLAGVVGGRDLALDAPLAEPAGDDDAVEVAQPALGQQALDLLGLDPLDLDLGAVVEAAVLERLDHRQVGVGQAHVLADDADAHRAGGRLDPVDQPLPLATGRAAPASMPRWRADDLVEALLVQHERHLVEVGGVGGVDDAPRWARRTAGRSSASARR